MGSNYSLVQLLKRLYWDIIDRNERKYYGYFFISGVPGLFGAMLRARYLSKRFKQAGNNLLVYSGARFRAIENLSVGDNVEIGHDNYIQARGNVLIGDNVMLAPGVKIWSVNHNYQDKDVLIKDQGVIKTEVVIGNDVWVGSNAFIMPGVHLPDGVVVSAGSVVGVKAYKSYSIIAGNPGRIIGYRGSKDDS